MTIALDATYSVGRQLSGVGIYSRHLILGLAERHPEARYLWCYRPHRFVRSLGLVLPRGCMRFPLFDALPPRSALFHGLNQRLPEGKLRRTVSTFHDLFVLTAEYSSPEFRARFAAQAREAAERSDLVIAVSRFTAHQVQELLRVPGERIRVVPHGVRFDADVSGGPREPVVLSVGAIQKRKNTLRLVEAFEQTPRGWRLLLAGSTGYESEEVLSRISRSSRRGDIELLGYVDDEKLRSLYARASIFAFPSLDEGFGIPVLEAMAAGVPVVTSNSGALAEVAGDAAALVDSRSTEAIAAGLEGLMNDGGLRDRLANSGRQRAREYSWERAVESTWRVYQELI